jgi:putative ABC transport system permease protein
MVSLMVTFLASFRIANISIANAVKDLPNAQKTGINWGNVILVMTLALSGLVLFFVAFWSSALPSNYKAYAMYFGILLFAWPAAYLWYKLRKTYVAFQVAAVGLIILTLLVTRIDFFERAWRNGPFLFVLNALVLLLCFTVLFVLSMERITRVILKVFSFLPRFSSQATIALRYPVEKKFRSTLTILVFALVIFIVTVVSVLRLQVNEVLNTSRSEFHIVIYDQLGREDVIARLDKEKYRLSEIKSIFKTDVGAITLPQYQYQNLPSFDPEAPLGVKPEDEYRDSVVTFGDNFFTSGVKIQSDKSVEEIKKLLTTTNTYVLLGKNYSRAADDLNLRPDIKPGETIQLKFPGNKSIERTVIGIVEDDNSPTVGVLETAVSSSGNSGVLLSETDYQHLRSTEKIYLAGVYGVQLQNPDDAERAGKAFREAFRGSNISSIYSVAEALTRSTQFINQLITLVQGFMALGLIVGVAGLAVVIIRSIHDRKVVIGTLRVLGYSPRMITTLFLTETVLLTVMGILIGFVSGVFASYLFYQYQLVGRTDLPLIIPYSELLWIFAAVTAASLIFSYLPARKAAKLPPVRAIQYIG